MPSTTGALSGSGTSLLVSESRRYPRGIVPAMWMPRSTAEAVEAAKFSLARSRSICAIARRMLRVMTPVASSPRLSWDDTRRPPAALSRASASKKSATDRLALLML
jgi:hypothetical protein